MVHQASGRARCSPSTSTRGISRPSLGGSFQARSPSRAIAAGCLVDDAHWLDEPTVGWLLARSYHVLALPFAARRMRVVADLAAAACFQRDVAGY